MAFLQLGSSKVKNRLNDGTKLILNDLSSPKLIELNIDNDASETYIQLGKDIYFGSSNKDLVFFNSDDEKLLSLSSNTVKFSQNIESDIINSSNIYSYNLQCDNIDILSNFNINQSINISSNIDIYTDCHFHQNVHCGTIHLDRIVGSNLRIDGLVLENFVTREGVFDNRIQIDNIEPNTVSLHINKLNNENSCNYIELYHQNSELFKIDKNGFINIPNTIDHNRSGTVFNIDRFDNNRIIQYDDNFMINSEGHISIGILKNNYNVNDYNSLDTRENNSLLHLHRRDDREQHNIIRDPILNITMDYDEEKNMITSNYKRTPFEIYPFFEEKADVIEEGGYKVIINLLPFMNSNVLWNKEGSFIQFTPELDDITGLKLYVQKYDYSDYNFEFINLRQREEFIENSSNILLGFSYWHTDYDRIIQEMNRLNDEEYISNIRDLEIEEFQFFEYNITCNIIDTDLITENNIELNITVRIIVEGSYNVDRYMEYIDTTPLLIQAPSMIHITSNNEHIFEINNNGTLIGHNMVIDDIMNVDKMIMSGYMLSDIDMCNNDITNLNILRGEEIYLNKLRIGDIVEITKDDGIVLLDSTQGIENKISTVNITNLNSPFLKYNDFNTTVLNSFNVGSNLEEIIEKRINVVDPRCMILGNLYMEGEYILDGSINMENYKMILENYNANNGSLIQSQTILDNNNQYIRCMDGVLSFANNGFISLSTKRNRNKMTIGIPNNYLESDTINFAGIDTSQWFLDYERIIDIEDEILANMHNISIDQFSRYQNNNVITVYGNARFSDRNNKTLVNIREYDATFQNEPTMDVYGNIRCRPRRTGFDVDGNVIENTDNIALSCMGNIVVDGKIVAKQGISSISDRNVKSNLEIIESPLDKVKKLSGYIFERIDINNKKETGLIAQEVQEVLPEAVNIDNETGQLSIMYGNLMGLIVEAIKELDNR